MKSAVLAGVALVLAAGGIGWPAQAAAIRPGSWEFAAHLQPSAAAPPAAAPQAAGGGQAPSSDGFEAPYTICVDAQKAVPALLGPSCKLDTVARQSARITWSMTCTNPDGAVHSDGVAQYYGDTMEATLVNHLPNAAGKVTDIRQRITGRYVGPCIQAARAPVGQPAPNAAASDASHWVEPPAATGTASPPASASAGPPAAAAGTAAAAGGAAAAGAAAPPAARAAATAAPPAQYRPRYASHHRYYRRHHRNYAGGSPNILALPFVGLRALFGR